jgi:glucose-6-phosphate 1-epimerase
MTCQTLLLDAAPAVRLEGPAGDVVTVLLRGAQVISWIDARGVERLYRSPTSPLNGPQAVRGGVPVIFPQFAAHGPLMRHGFARTRDWTLQPFDASAPEPCIALRLHNAVGDDPQWPHACICTLTVSLQTNGLRMTLAIENTGPTAFPFQAALHTYLAVGELAKARLIGVLPEGAVLLLGESIDHIFEAAAGPFQLDGPLGPLELVHTGFVDTVVWNPGPNAGLVDLPPGDHTRFVCVEAAVVVPPVVLAPGARWQGSQALLSSA